MFNYLKSDLIRTGVLSVSLLVFSLFIQPSPPAAGLIAFAQWRILPLNAAVANRFYTQAMNALQAGKPDAAKIWLVEAIQVDPQPFSPRYKEFTQQRTQWLAQ